MIPISNSPDTGCPDALSSNCVRWDGPNIPALGIKTKDNVTKVEYSLATKICFLVNAIDVSDLDLSGLIASIPQGNHTIKQVLQYLLDNQSALKDLIDNIDGGSSSGAVDMTGVNMRCLKKFDEFQNEIPQNIQQAIQSIVTQVCTNTTDIANIKSGISDLQDQIDGLDLTPTVNIPNVSTCISTSKPVTTALIETSAVVCDIQEILGETLDIQDSLSKQCTGLKTKIGNPEGFIDTVNTISDSLNNIWLSVCNILARVDHIEKTCCAPTCDILKIGFITEFGDNNTVTLKFTTGAGTVIPEGFTDCGSELTITNQDGLTFGPMVTSISQGGTIDDIDLSAFEANDTLIFSIMAKLCSSDLHCEKCVAKEVKYSPEGCCVMTNTGTEDITIIYETTVTSLT